MMSVTDPTPGVNGATSDSHRGPERSFSFRAEKGKLDARTPLLYAMGYSLWINPSWFNKCLQLREMWIQNQMAAIRSAGELSRYLSRTSDEIGSMRMQAGEQRQASQDRISQQCSEHILSTDVNCNPNVSTQGTWQRVDPTRGGGT
jgi:hypothetical protein